MTQLKNGAKKYVSPMYTPVVGPIKTGYDAYTTLLSVEKSPLRKMPPMVGHLVFTVLAWMWSGIFGLYMGSYMIWGVSAVGHMLLISGAFITWLIWQQADRGNSEKGFYNGRGPGGEHE